MPGRRSTSPRDEVHEQVQKLRRLRPEEQARVLAKLVRLKQALAAAPAALPEHQADLALLQEEVRWVQREGVVRRASIPRLVKLFTRYGIE